MNRNTNITCLACEACHPRQFVRGLCRGCYAAARKAMQERHVTEAELISIGLLLPSRSAGSKFAARRKIGSRTYRVYTIRDHQGCVRYVGCTSKDLKKRLQTHRCANTRIGIWIRGELQCDRAVRIVCEEEFHSDNGTDNRFYAYAVERKYIRGYRKLLGGQLLNGTQGQRAKSQLLLVETA